MTAPAGKPTIEVMTKRILVVAYGVGRLPDSSS